MGLFSVLLVITTALFTESLGVWRRTDSSDSANREMRKAEAAIERDLELASVSQLSTTPVPPSLGAGNDGDAIWFLSPVDPTTRKMALKDDGSPFWQRNILYYLVVPQNHDATVGMSCNGVAGPTGFESACPHKVLIRKVIDSGTPTVTTDPTTEEALITNISPYLTRPLGYDVSAMSEPGLEETSIVASRLLGFDILPGSVAAEVNIDLRAVEIEEARRETSVGLVSMFTGRFTQHASVSVFLKN